MLIKFKEFWAKPVTWGAYAKACLIGYVIGMFILFIIWVCYGLIKFPNKFMKNRGNIV